jgi:hypothetical protein
MVRMLVVLLWISLVIGTYVSGNVVGNWLVCLLGLYVFIRSRRRQSSLPPTATGPSVLPPRAARPVPAATAGSPHTSADQQRRRWR